jgi:PAT family beta-lactamase induction signal transducer AmpG
MIDETAQIPNSRSLWASVVFACSSRRTLAVTLMSFASGIPLGLVWIAIPDWMRSAGLDIRAVGLITLAHAPWTFKMLWSPLMDRYSPPWLGRRRGWIAITQIGLFALFLVLSGMGSDPDAPMVLLALALAIAFMSASQDIVIDAYAVEILHADERGIAVGARTAFYRLAMYVAGAMSITFASMLSWQVVNLILALLFLPMVLVTLRAPEPETVVPTPRTMRQAIWLPFVGFLSRQRALEILAFVLLFKLADNLSQSLLRPFLVDMGYDAIDRGVAMGTVGLIGTIVGTFLGGALTTVIGLGRSLWLFGFLQIVSNLGYIFVAYSDTSRTVMYAAMGFETLTTGTGMGAFGVFLLRITQKRFSVTQYALFSSLFALPRLIAGPVTGFLVHAVGWVPFFWFTMAAGVPGLVLLQRFVPFGTRDPVFALEDPRVRKPLSTTSLAVRGGLGGLVAFGLALLLVSTLSALERLSENAAGGFQLLECLRDVVVPGSFQTALALLGTAAFGVICGLFTAAVFAARHGTFVLEKE